MALLAFVGIVLIVQGLIHLMGFVAYLRLATIEAWPYSTALLYGSLEVSKAGAVVYGLLCHRSAR